MAATRTLLQLRTDTLRAADMEYAAPGHVATAEVTDRVNDALFELYDKLMAARGPDYYATSTNTSTVSGTAAYALPAAFYQLLHAELYDGSRYYRLRPWQWDEHAILKNAEATNTSPPSRIRYRLTAANVELRPVPRAVYTLTLYYVPAMTRLSSDSDTFDGINGWERWAVLTAAIALMAKDQADTTEHRAERARIDERIASLAAARDASRPPHVIPSRGHPWSLGSGDELPEDVLWQLP